MNSNIDDGGPAFPITAGQQVYAQGMTLRDWFAGLAMQGFCADPSSHKVFDDMSDAAENAYLVADAMMEARK